MSRSVVLAAAFVFAAGAASAEPLSVVATFSILGDMTARVGGDRVHVTTLVGPDGDAHVYQPTPADARTLAAADLVVLNGLGFEGFMTRLVEAAGYVGPVVTASMAVRPLALEGGDGEAAAVPHDDAHASGEAGQEHGSLDPHAWQDIKNGLGYVTAIEQGLCAVDVAGCPIFQANAQNYRAELEALDADIAARIAAVPAARRMVITTHDAFQYFGAAYGVTFLAPQGVSTDAEASAGDVAALIQQIRALEVTVIFVESISDPRLIQQIAAETGARIGGALYSDALSAPGKGADSYLGMMKHNADAIIAAMESTS